MLNFFRFSYLLDKPEDKVSDNLWVLELMCQHHLVEFEKLKDEQNNLLLSQLNYPPDQIQGEAISSRRSLTMFVGVVTLRYQHHTMESFD